MTRGISIHLGLNEVDPRHYQGWAGPLTACEFDANDMEAIARSAGFETSKLLTRSSTRAALQQAFEKAISSLGCGDMFFISYSGHGGQLPDVNSDETNDLLDETWCLYDGEWIDDETYSFLRQFQRGVRILVISDSCHSGTPHKNGLLMRSLEIDDDTRYRAMPNEVAIRTYEANREFYNQIRSKNDLRAEQGQVKATLISLGACQDNELAADGTFNGRFTGALKSVWNNGSFRGNYVGFYHNIRVLMPNNQVPSFEIEGVMINSFEDQRPFSLQGEKPMQSTETPAASSHLPWQWGGRIEQQWGRSRSRPTTAASSVPDGAYVTAMGRSNGLFRVQNGRRQAIDPTDIVAMGITQNDIQEVDPFMLHSIPLEVTRQRAIGRDLQTYLWSDLRAGHFMQSWVWLQGTTLTVQTQTETVTWFGGYTGGVEVVLFDAGGNRILHDPIRYRYGVDGRAFGSGLRNATETAQLPQNVANTAESILIAHYWDPKVNYVAIAIQLGAVIWEVIQLIRDAQQQGQEVNAGGDPF